MLYTPWHSEPSSSGAAAEPKHHLVLAPSGGQHRAFAVRSVQGRRTYQEDSFDVRTDLLGLAPGPLFHGRLHGASGFALGLQPRGLPPPPLQPGWS